MKKSCFLCTRVSSWSGSKEVQQSVGFLYSVVESLLSAQI